MFYEHALMAFFSNGGFTPLFLNSLPLTHRAASQMFLLRRRNGPRIKAVA